ncbi:hypothetical protein E3T23_13465 [Cryobacterium cheniae]|uniref:Uncharacterized protein n=1 Tax=Cryobacterium cheniae TaxID=1259262 RepID=A0A4R8XL94_9MICO|nr:hypothetical protein [Cryobacterium cheniae]TFC77445.1 hypothetical protein E3T23_13465 [Cryobacterium cheniae]
MADTGTRKPIREAGLQTQFTQNPPPPGRDIGINALSSTEWRISDRMIADGDPAALVGFIQRVDDAFEVTDFGRPRERSYFSSFDRAAASLALRPAPTRVALR